MYLCIDSGNTRIKLGLFDNNGLRNIEICDDLSDEILLHFIERHNIHALIYSNVRASKPSVIDSLSDRLFFIELNHTTPVPINSLYKTPATLGKDRLAGIVAAHTIYDQTDVMVISAGTALTIDYLQADGTYIGGNISLGLHMRFNALHHFTGKLPLASPQETFVACGQNTEQALVAGVQNGMIYEIQGYIDAFVQKWPNAKVILSGGDCFFFENKIKRTIFAHPNLVVEGLYRILTYNEKI